MDDLLNRVHNMSQMNLAYKDGICNQLATNPYMEALRTVFLERKEAIRDPLHSTLFFGMPSTDRIQQVLETNLEGNDLMLSNEEQKDEDMQEMERRYQSTMKRVKNELNITVTEIEKGSLIHEKHMADTLRDQMRWRPIDQTDLDRAHDSIVIRHQQAQEECREAATNCVLLIRNQINDARKRRRNFSREAVEILQDYFNAHKDHPYPSDEDKERLAAKCNITVQQVSNWFGNRRIRNKKAANGNDLCSETHNYLCPDYSMQYNVIDEPYSHVHGGPYYCE